MDVAPLPTHSPPRLTKAPPKSIAGSTAPLAAVLSRSNEPGKLVPRGGSADQAEAHKRTRRRKPE